MPNLSIFPQSKIYTIRILYVGVIKFSQDGGTPLPDGQILQANPEVQGNVIEQSFAEDDMDNMEEAEVAIDTEAADNKDNDDMAKKHILLSELWDCK